MVKVVGTWTRGDPSTTPSVSVVMLISAGPGTSIRPWILSPGRTIGFRLPQGWGEYMYSYSVLVLKSFFGVLVLVLMLEKLDVLVLVLVLKGKVLMYSRVFCEYFDGKKHTSFVSLTVYLLSVALLPMGLVFWWTEQI